MSKNNIKNNRGMQLKTAKVLSFLGAVRILEKIQDGKVFRVDFIKKTDGKKRTMVCRTGVRSKATGAGAKYSFSLKGLLSVWEFGKGYRAIPIENIIFIKQGSVLYDFRRLLHGFDTYSIGEYPVNGLYSSRTIPAHNSPMSK